MRVAVAGFGRIGRRLVELLHALPGYSVVAVGDSKGYAVNPNGLGESCIRELLSMPRGGVRLASCGREGSLLAALEELDYDALVLVTASSHDSGEPGLAYARTAVEQGRVLVSADKPPLAHALYELAAKARETGSIILYKAAVMAGTPLIDLLRLGLRGRRVKRVVGALNTTTNYVLSLVEEGVGFEEAVERAVREGIAEPDPRADLEGLDLAAKAAVVAQTLGCRTTLREVEVQATAYDARSAGPARLVAEVDAAGCKARVTLHRVRGPDDPFAAARGLRNVVVVEPEGSEPIVLSGPGAGVEVTVQTILSDLELARILRSNP